MKQSISIILVLFVNITAFAQDFSLSATYSLAIQNKEITKSDTPKILKGIEYILSCSTKKSEFKLIEKMSSDAIRANKRFTRKSGAFGIFYKDLEKKEKFHFTELLGEKFLIKKELENTGWKLTKETKKIDKYTCYKAIYKLTNPIAKGYSINVTAWYAPEISLPFGPVGYDGLPGLILELSYLDYIFVAKNIDFQANINIKRPKGKIITQEELSKQFKRRTGFDVEKNMKEKSKKIKEKKQ